MENDKRAVFVPPESSILKNMQEIAKKQGVKGNVKIRRVPWATIGKK